MNDWLLSMERRGPVMYPDVLGEFYDPVRPGLGPPHSSSTGVYLEGLAAAYQVARDLGDTVRQARYRDALRYGLRSAMQAAFHSSADLYYVTHRFRVRGGLRWTVFNNGLRIDNVQHTLNAVKAILEIPAFDVSS